MNGGETRGGYYGAVTADRERCSRRGTSAFTGTQGYRGFRLNGARRGGAGYGNYEYQAYCERSAYRLYYTKNSGYNTIGFR